MENDNYGNIVEKNSMAYIYGDATWKALLTGFDGKTTKYVYGIGLIGQEKQCSFKTYHFDYRGSTIALTDECGNITDTFAYDTYGKLISRTSSTFIIFGYNGRDVVIADLNGWKRRLRFLYSKRIFLRLG